MTHYYRHCKTRAIAYERNIVHNIGGTVLLSQICPFVRPSDDHSSFLSPTVVGGRCPIRSESCIQSVPLPFEKTLTSTDFRLNRQR